MFHKLPRFQKSDRIFINYLKNKPAKIQKKEVWKAQLQSCGTAVAAGGMSEKKSMLISLLPIQLPRSLNGFN